MPKKSSAPATSPSATLSLTDLKPAKGAVRKATRVGRGRATGVGKTSGRGHNGEGQRSGQSLKRGFEGGQMPGYRRMPKINGFRLVNPKSWLELNVGQLDSLIPADQATVTYELLSQLGLLKNQMDGVRLLGNGDLKRALTIEAHHVTPGAKQKIEAAGGTVTLLA